MNRNLFKDPRKSSVVGSAAASSSSSSTRERARTISRIQFLNRLLLVGLVLTICVFSANGAQPSRAFRAGASAINITPEKFPAIVNGGFLEAQASKANDPLHARALVLDDGTTRIALVVVDSCMLPRDLIDDAKRVAHEKTGLSVDSVLISATHTHSAPSAMGCLGASVDLEYVKELPSKIVAAIETAERNLKPARIGWAVADDSDHTHNRRWIYRPDKMKTDPFGEKSVRANMHPGYENPDCIGPSGPVDPGLSVVAVQSLQGKPIAVLANYSMHYFGAAPVSADYYGRFAEKIKNLVGAQDREPPFVGIMSQGTSGDQMWMDYGQPRRNLSLDQYAEGIARAAFSAYQKIQFHDWVSLAMSESTLTLRRRAPNEERLAWARQIVANLEGRKPTNQVEVYAREQIFLHDDPVRELKLQAVRIGELGITAIPDEVFAITGLKIKTLSPLTPTFTIELANGSEGYIPPPAQHALGGYTTWPARTAALEVEAEPKITEAVLQLLEQVAGKPRRKFSESDGSYAKAVLASKPIAFWRLGEFSGSTAFDSSGHNNHATYEGGIAFFLDGPAPPGFSGAEMINRCVHLAGGRLRASIKGLRDKYSVEMWFWNGLPANARSITGVLFSRGVEGASASSVEKVLLPRTNGPEGALVHESHSFWHQRGWNSQSHGGTAVALKAWNHLVFARDREQVRVFLNGNPAPEISTRTQIPDAANDPEFVIGGEWHATESSFEGKIDEVAIYNRALTPREVARHFQAADRRR